MELFPVLKVKATFMDRGPFRCEILSQGNCSNDTFTVNPI